MAQVCISIIKSHKWDRFNAPMHFISQNYLPIDPSYYNGDATWLNTSPLIPSKRIHIDPSVDDPNAYLLSEEYWEEEYYDEESEEEESEEYFGDEQYRDKVLYDEEYTSESQSILCLTQRSRLIAGKDGTLICWSSTSRYSIG